MLPWKFPHVLFLVLFCIFALIPKDHPQNNVNESIHNSQAKIYLRLAKYKNIRHMLDLSFEKIMTYINCSKFNFWNLLPPNQKFKKGEIIGNQPLRRRPTNYKVKTKYINNTANVIEVSDDTCLGYTAFALKLKYQISIQ